MFTPETMPAHSQCYTAKDICSGESTYSLFTFVGGNQCVLTRNREGSRAMVLLLSYKETYLEMRRIIELYKGSHFTLTVQTDNWEIPNRRDPIAEQEAWEREQEKALESDWESDQEPEEDHEVGNLKMRF